MPDTTIQISIWRNPTQYLIRITDNGTQDAEPTTHSLMLNNPTDIAALLTAATDGHLAAHLARTVPSRHENGKLLQSNDQQKHIRAAINDYIKSGGSIQRAKPASERKPPKRKAPTINLADLLAGLPAQQPAATVRSAVSPPTATLRSDASKTTAPTNSQQQPKQDNNQ